jgi:hypothetical protein
MINVNRLGQTLQNLFGRTAHEAACETKFEQRQSKLTGLKFMQVMVLGFLQHPSASLNMLCQVAADLGVDITKQGLQKRLTSAAVEFMQTMFEHSQAQLQNKVPIPLPLLTQFTAVHLVDSSGIGLPDSLAAEFPGSGGDGPEAGLKLQTIWEFLRSNLTAVWITTGREPDQGFRGHLAHMIPGALFLCDLGYFKLTSLGHMITRGAYFISRFDTHCGLLEPVNGARFDLLAYLTATLEDQVELDLLVGCRTQLDCRVLALQLPAKVVAERRRKARANARRKGRTLSAEKLAWLAWSVYITNVPDTMLTMRQVVLIYTLRWQIELLFKLWKSEGQLDRVAGKRRERVLCEVYAKLIGMVIFHYLTAPVRWAERELSPVKALQIFRRYVDEMALALDNLPDLCNLLDKLTSRWQRFALKDKRRKRLSTCRQIELAAALSLG